jgi:hypothetical protein
LYRNGFVSNIVTRIISSSKTSKSANNGGASFEADDTISSSFVCTHNSESVEKFARHATLPGFFFGGVCNVNRSFSTNESTLKSAIAHTLTNVRTSTCETYPPTTSTTQKINLVNQLVLQSQQNSCPVESSRWASDPSLRDFVRKTPFDHTCEILTSQLRRQQLHREIITFRVCAARAPKVNLTQCDCLHMSKSSELFQRWMNIAKTWPGYRAERKERNLSLFIERRATAWFGTLDESKAANAEASAKVCVCACVVHQLELSRLLQIHHQLWCTMRRLCGVNYISWRSCTRMHTRRATLWIMALCPRRHKVKCASWALHRRTSSARACGRQ